MARVISITEALGSGGPQIGRLTGDRLGMPVVDREVFLWAAQEAGRQAAEDREEGVENLEVARRRAVRRVAGEQPLRRDPALEIVEASIDTVIQ